MCPITKLTTTNMPIKSSESTTISFLNKQNGTFSSRNSLFTHKEMWWWNEEVAEAVREKKKKYGNWKKRKIDRGTEVD